MGVPWWAWLLIGLYIAPGVWGCVGITKDILGIVPQIPGLEEDEEHRKPPPRWLKFVILPLVFIFLLVFWPIVAYGEIRR